MKDALEVLQTLQGTPLPNLLVIAGLLLVLLGFAGKIGAFIELSPQRQKIAGFFGFMLLIFGIGLFTLPKPPVPAPSSTPSSSGATQVTPPSNQKPEQPAVTTVAPPQPTPRPTDTPIPPTAYFTYALDYGGPVEITGGGGEGGEEMDVSCPAGYVATGLIGGSGVYIDRIGLQCSWLESNGTTSDITTTEMHGGGGGNEFSLTCPEDQFLTSVMGGAGVYVDRVSGHCESVDAARSYDSAPAGGEGGNPYAANCPAGYAITGIHGGSGVWVDRVNVICNRINKIRH